MTSPAADPTRTASRPAVHPGAGAPVDRRTPRISFVVPAHNEAATLPDTVPILRARLESLPGSEVIVVENGSVDETRAVAERLAAQPGPVPVRVASSAPGIGAAYRQGIELAAGDTVVLSAADLPFRFTDLDGLLVAVDRPPFAIGSKGHPDSVVERSWTRRLLSAVFLILRRFVLGMQVRDPQGSFLIDAALAKMLVGDVTDDGFFFTTELTAAALRNGVEPVELPVTLAPERRASTVHPLRDGVRMLRAMRRLRARHSRGLTEATVTAWVVGILLAVAAVSVPTQPHSKDPAVYFDAVRRMWHGSSYYPAMQRALFDGGIGPVQSPRGFRSPWLFEFWGLLGGERLMWTAFLVGVAVAVIAARALVRHPAALIGLAVVMVGIGAGAYASVEIWAVPWVLAALAASVTRRDRGGGLAATVAILARELSLPVAVAGLFGSLRRGGRLWPWLAALGIAMGSFAIHAVWAAPYLATPGRDAPLLGSADAWSWFRLVGFGLPFGVVLGPLVTIAAAWQVTRRRWWWELGPTLAFGLVGFVVERPYWGAMVVPIQVLLAGDLIADLIARRRSGDVQHALQGNAGQ